MLAPWRDRERHCVHSSQRDRVATGALALRQGLERSMGRRHITMGLEVIHDAPMPNAFDFSSSPFDGLDADEQRLVRDGVHIAYFREGETILEPGIEPSHLFVVIKGHVSQLHMAAAYP